MMAMTEYATYSRLVKECCDLSLLLTKPSIAFQAHRDAGLGLCCDLCLPPTKPSKALQAHRDAGWDFADSSLKAHL